MRRASPIRICAPALALSVVGGAAVQETWPGLDELPELSREHGLDEPLAELVQKFETLAAATKAERVLATFTEWTGAPLSAPAGAIALTDELAAAASEEHPGALLARAGLLLDLAPASPAAVPTGDFESLLDEVEHRLESAGRKVAGALAEVPPDELPELRARAWKVLEDLVSTVYVHGDPSHVETWRKLSRVDQRLLLEAAALLAPMMDPAFARDLRDAWRRERPERPDAVPGVEGRVLYARDTDVGPIVIGSTAANRYVGPAAFVLDLGGNDTYSAAATSSDLGRPVNLVIDLDGDDRYESDGPCGQAAGVFGVSLLADHAGDDVYRGGRLVQGAALVGVGVLVDARGDDRYEGDVYAQGSAPLLGMALLVDRRGRDELTAYLYSMGYGGPGSCGVLVDVAGDDRRTARGRYPSSYGTEGQYSAHSMGSGLGFRVLDWTTPKAAGGFGILVDVKGDDVSTVGEFGFGIGYFMGTGIVRDMEGDDEVHASRYGIATGAHYGVGIVLDDAGDDRWDNPYTASLAGNWDLTFSFLLDARGNDHYTGGGITLGGSTITSLACLIDGDGEDRYEAGGRDCFGGAGHAQDVGRGSRCLAYFIDLGGDADAYPKTGHAEQPADGLTTVRRRTDTDAEKGTAAETGVGLFVDR